MASSVFGTNQAVIPQLPSGSLVDYAGTSAPDGWLMCDGRAVSRSVYASLFTAIGISYGAGDGSTTFNIPDFRGRFARYMDNMGTAQGAASRDTGRIHGSTQADAMQDHTHNTWANGGISSSLNAANVASTVVSGNTDFTNRNLGNPIENNSRGAPRVSSETRPINLSCNKIIKF
jgi:microcystin-dependent protein